MLGLVVGLPAKSKKPYMMFSEEYSTLEMWQEVYNHDKVLTLDEIPFHSHTDNNNDNICDYCRGSLFLPEDSPADTNKTLLICITVFLVILIILSLVALIIRKKIIRKQ